MKKIQKFVAALGLAAALAFAIGPVSRGPLPFPDDDANQIARGPLPFPDDDANQIARGPLPFPDDDANQLV
jgi:predicted small lipoprotein YifL